MMDQSLASLVTQERDDYFGRFFHSLGSVMTTLNDPSQSWAPGKCAFNRARAATLNMYERVGVLRSEVQI